MTMPKQTIFHGWYIVAACFVLCLLFAGGGFYSFSIFIRPLEDQFGWDRSAISLTMSIYLIIGGLAGPLLGQFILKHGPRKVMRICALGAGACFILISLTEALWYFYAAYAVLAVMLCGIGVIPVSTLLSFWFEKRRGTAIGIALVGISAGGLVLAPAVGFITAAYDWKVAFLGIGVLVWAVSLPVIHFGIRDKPEQMGLLPYNGPTANHHPLGFEPRPVVLVTGWPAKTVFRDKSFWCIFTAFCLAPMAQMGVLQHQVPLLMDIGISEPSAAAILGATAGIGGLGKLGFGRISESWSFRNVILLCFGLQAAAIALLVYATTPAMIWIYAVTFGFGMGGIIVLMPLVVGHFYGLLAYGVILGALWVGNAAGGAVGTYVSGLVYDVSGNYRYALFLFIAAYVVSIIAFFMAGKPDPQLNRASTDRR
jgi:sugar phosphate permease